MATNDLVYLSGVVTPQILSEPRSDLGLLLTPRMGNRPDLSKVAWWGIDNGCFAHPVAGEAKGGAWAAYFDWLKSMQPHAGNCAFACAIDFPNFEGEPMDMVTSLNLSYATQGPIRDLGFKVALVLQPGMEERHLAFEWFDAYFVGGDDEWKMGPEAEALVRAAKAEGKWVHMGRVNSLKRMLLAQSWGCDSVDGTYLKFGRKLPDGIPENLPRLHRFLDIVNARPKDEVAAEAPEPEPTRWDELFEEVETVVVPEPANLPRLRRALDVDGARPKPTELPTPDSPFCQRWTDRVPSWRHTSEGGFDPSAYEVAPIDLATARDYVIRHHYSGSYPADRLRYGLFCGPDLVGVAVLSVPVQRAVLTGVFPQLEAYAESLELGRFVLADGVPANGESWFLGQLFRLAADAGLRGVVSFSDPLPRQAGDRLVMPGHVGTIYQASNALYLGRGRARRLTVLPDGTILNDRSIAKIRAQDQGHEYVERRLVAFGAQVPRAGQDMARWLDDALHEAGARLVDHRGNHRYAFAIGSPAARRSVLRQVTMAQQAYPKRADQAA